MEELVKYSIVIPVFQAREYIHASVTQVVKAMDAIGQPYEILLVDDNSSDGTWDALQQVKSRFNNVRIISLSKNVGQTPATMAGAQLAKGAFIITLDDDLQHPPEEIPKLIAAFNSNEVDAVFGDPEIRYHPNKQHPILVAIGKFMFHYVYLRPYRKLNFFTTFRLFRADLLRVNGGPWSHLFFIWQLHPARAMHVPTKHIARRQGQSNHTLIKLIRHFAPFLWYFLLRSVWALQVLLLVVAAGFYINQYRLENIDLSQGRSILVLALVTIVVKFAIVAVLKRMERMNFTFKEG